MTQREDGEYELGRQMEGSTAGEALLLKGVEGRNSFIYRLKHFRHSPVILILLQIHTGTNR